MSNVFAEAAAEIHADPDFGEDAQYRAGSGQAAIPVRVVRLSYASDVVTLGVRVRQKTTVFELLRSAVTFAPGDGHTLQTAQGTFRIYDTRLGEMGLTWNLFCQEAGSEQA
ncbi:hypothetical protein ACI2KH_22175 [Roseomonas mucosa]|uniref:head-tail joining protein n=1 Tax=Roseomonas mucosa TaxID=207340 RepID=UPI00384E8EEE